LTPEESCHAFAPAFILATSMAMATGLPATARVVGANGQVGVAVIGVNGMGHAHVKTLTARSDAES
jgi:hypothetical protein